MVKHLCVAVLLCTSIFSNSCAQTRDSLMKAYNENTIYKFGNYYIKGNQRMTFHELGGEFYTPATREMYRLSKRRAAISRIFNVASLGLIITSILTHTNVKGSIEFAAGTGVLGLGALYFQSQSSRYLERAIWERNKMILANSVSQ